VFSFIETAAWFVFETINAFHLSNISWIDYGHAYGDNYPDNNISLVTNYITIHKGGIPGLCVDY
jgi:hypothetical protein